LPATWQADPVRTWCSCPRACCPGSRTSPSLGRRLPRPLPRGLGKRAAALRGPRDLGNPLGSLPNPPRPRNPRATRASQEQGKAGPRGFVAMRVLLGEQDSFRRDLESFRAVNSGGPSGGWSACPVLKFTYSTCGTGWHPHPLRRHLRQRLRWNGRGPDRAVMASHT